MFPILYVNNTRAEQAPAIIYTQPYDGGSDGGSVSSIICISRYNQPLSLSAYAIKVSSQSRGRKLAPYSPYQARISEGQ